MSLYLRELQHLVRNGETRTSSQRLAARLGLKDAQVRKDLSCLGRLGYPGIGYRCEELIEQIRNVLGTNRAWRVALLGAGNLGRALLGYRGFSHQGFEITDAFDADPAKVGLVLGAVPVHAMSDLARIVAEKRIELAMIAVPAEFAPAVASAAAAAGVRGLLNFAPITVTAPRSVEMVGVDLAVQLEQLAFAVVNRRLDG